MTIERYSRCIHCGCEYVWCVSGEGYNHPNSPSKDYCPTCFAAIEEATRNALAKIPRLYEDRYQDVKEIPEFSWVTLEKVLEWEAKTLEDNPESKNWARRIWPGLIDDKTGKYQYIRLVRGREEASSFYFRVSTWPHRPEFSIEMLREYDLVNQKFTGYHWPR